MYRVCLGLPGIRCNRLYQGIGGRCPEHKRAFGRLQRAGRPTPAQRGYGWAWSELSKRVRAEEPLCFWCKRDIAAGRMNGPAMRSAVADHVIPLSQGGTSDRSNLVGACFSHNRRRAVTR
jgi:5-methylcytosine-specific restriction enzyme A